MAGKRDLRAVFWKSGHNGSRKFALSCKSRYTMDLRPGPPVEVGPYNRIQGMELNLTHNSLYKERPFFNMGEYRRSLFSKTIMLFSGFFRHNPDYTVFSEKYVKTDRFNQLSLPETCKSRSIQSALFLKYFSPLFKPDCYSRFSQGRVERP